MKKWMWLQLLTKFKYYKKLKVIFLSGLFLMFFTIGIAIWGGIATMRFVESRIENLQLQDQLTNLKSDISNSSCLQEAKGLLIVENWNQLLALDHWENLKFACLENHKKACEESECNSPKELTKPPREMEII